jgi:hypothetical protein
MRTSIALIALTAACAKAAAKPTAPRRARAGTPDAETRFTCDTLDATPKPVVECAPGGGACTLTYIATPMTTSPGGYEVGDPIAVDAEATAWRVFENGERLHVDILDGKATRLVIDALLSGAFGSEGTVGREFVGVVRTPATGAPAPMRAVSLAGRAHTPATTHDDVRVAVRCALATDLQE